MTRMTFVTLLLFTLPVSAEAQEGLTTGSTIQGHNTIQQAPSGGTTRGDPGLNMPNANQQGLPDAEEKRIEQKNNAATQICKGC